MALAQIYTIGFTHKSAETFFNILKQQGIQQLMDIRLNNTSQLAAFTKRQDLAFFLKQIVGAGYVHEPLLAPTEDILKPYQKQQIDWREYERRFSQLMKERQVEKHISKEILQKKTVLLCSEATPEHCHRRLVAEYLSQNWGDIEVIHL